MPDGKFMVRLPPLTPPGHTAQVTGSDVKETFAATAAEASFLYSDTGLQRLATKGGKP